ncbi:DUF4434 domain-containing protein [Longispora albida]|uniref:DUF4434 domain-containing protein n=1 Tax=Longispora albida TaxID=203523 RepID=UPI0003817DBE|nr:DUF4434 domain-containing protein [Longispora albida]
MPTAAGAAPAAATVRVGSTIVDVAAAASWKPETWESEFRYLQEAGLTELVLSSALTKNDATGTTTAYYPAGIANVTRATGPDGTPVDVVALTLRQARKYGMKVWLGTYTDGKSWFTYDDKTGASRAKANQAITQTVMGELDRKYGSYKDVVRGWYLSSEISSHWAWFWTARAALTQYYKDLTGTARTLTLTQRTMIAPFYNVHALPSPDLWRDLWVPALTAATVDVVALQDGTGDVIDEKGKPILLTPAEERRHLETKYQATRAAIDKANASRGVTGKPDATVLWADLEFYNSTGWPKPIGDIASVVETIRNDVTGYTSWSFTHQTSPNSTNKGIYHRPFVTWNTTGTLPAAPVQTPPGLTTTSTGVSWQPSQPAPGNALSHYRISTSGNVLLDLVYDKLTFDTNQPCVKIEAVDTIGNRSGTATNCTS